MTPEDYGIILCILAFFFFMCFLGMVSSYQNNYGDSLCVDRLGETSQLHKVTKGSYFYINNLACVFDNNDVVDYACFKIIKDKLVSEECD